MAGTDELPFVDFVNSDWFDGAGNSKDVLAQTGWLDAFVGKWLSGVEGPQADVEVLTPLGPLRPAEDAHHTGVGRRGLALLRDLRDTLRALIDATAAGEPPPPDQLERLQRFLEPGALHYRVGPGPDGGVALALEAEPDDAAAIAAAVALSAARFLAEGDTSRLKQCDNAGCRWVFYDASKNNSRRWCYSRLCGNVDKVRRYRERTRAEARAR